MSHDGEGPVSEDRETEQPPGGGTPSGGVTSGSPQDPAAGSEPAGRPATGSWDPAAADQPVEGGLEEAEDDA